MQGRPWTTGRKWSDLFFQFDQEVCKTVNVIQYEHIHESTAQVSVFVVEKSDRLHLCYCSASSSDTLLSCCTLTFGKHTVTHLVEGRRGQITVGLVVHCFQASKIRDARCMSILYNVNKQQSYLCNLQKNHSLSFLTTLHWCFFLCFLCIWSFLVLLTR